MDLRVLDTQVWLNLNYHGKSGYKVITADGITGWGTMKALIIALQIELKIPSPNGNFGPGTAAAFKGLSINSPVTDKNKMFILGGALYCKGYNPKEAGVFTSLTKNAIIEFQTDAGLSNKDGVVNAAIMKSLLAMDAFKLVEQGDANVRTVQQNLNHDYTSIIGIMPCDGIYSRSTNTALIKALQHEQGTSPDGFWGENTMKACPTIPGSKATKKFILLLQYALCCNHQNPYGFDGLCGQGLQKAIIEFQKFSHLTADGYSGGQTWASLLISTGDNTRIGTACDCSTTITSEKAIVLKTEKYNMIGRYLTGTYKLTPAELKIIFSAGLNVFPIFETGGYTLRYFSYGQGIGDAREAILAARKLGFKPNTIIYFGVDFDAIDTDVTERILPYFKGIKEEFDSLTSTYKIGIYAPRNVCSRISKEGYSCSSFVCDMSTGFSGNLGYPLPQDWSIDQISTVTKGSGTSSIEIDNNISRGTNLGESSIQPVDHNHSYEYIVAVGQEGNFKRWKYNFIEPSIKKIKEYVDNKADYYSKDTITWLIEETSYSDTDCSNFRNSAKRYGVNIVFVKSKLEFISYVNTGSINAPSTRTKKIKEFTLFGHGHIGLLNFGKNYDITIDDIVNINENSFHECHSVFFSCNTATNNQSSFAYKWKQKAKGMVEAVVNRTDYEYIVFLDPAHIEGTDEGARVEGLRLKTGYLETGAFRYPICSKDDKAYWVIF